MDLLKSDNINDQVYKFKKNIIVDMFPHDNDIIAVLDNKAFKGMHRKTLLLAKLMQEGKTTLLKPLTGEEYVGAAKKYNMLYASASMVKGV